MYKRMGLLLAPLMLLLAGCKIGPNYKTPDIKTPDKWSAITGGGENDGPVTIIEWWTTLKDPTLSSLITRAAENNLDIKAAEARVREARAARGITAAGLLPTLGATGGYSRNQRVETETASGSPVSFGGAVNANGFTPSVTVRGRNVTVTQSGIGSTGNTSFGITPGSQSAPGRESDLFKTGFDASWELDVFGGKQRAVEAADADIQAAEEARRGIVLSLIGEVALSYIDLREAQSRLAITQKNIEAQEATARITADRFKAGLSSELDNLRAQTQLTTTKSQLPLLDTLVQTAIHRIGVLLGEAPGSLKEELSTTAPLPEPPDNVPVGLPSDLLRRRPDIRQAERNLAASTARIGQAMAERFPKFSLTGSIAGQSDHLGSLLDSANRTWSIGPGISVPIFQGGRILANIEVQNARQEQAALTYEQRILTALADVENGLVSFAREQERIKTLQLSIETGKKAVDLASERYESGLEGFLNVLTAQQSLYQLEDQMVQNQGSILTNLISLYKALGGGWEIKEPAPTPTPEPPAQ